MFEAFQTEWRLKSVVPIITFALSFSIFPFFITTLVTYVVTYSYKQHEYFLLVQVLVVPFDCRIPKIRISTTQIEKLKNHR